MYLHSPMERMSTKSRASWSLTLCIFRKLPEGLLCTCLLKDSQTQSPRGDLPAISHTEQQEVSGEQ